MKKAILVIGFVLLTASLAFCADELSYKIKSSRVSEDTFWVTVAYKYGDYEETVEVPLFQPATKADIIQGIENRGLTIKRKVDATATNEILKPEIDKAKDKITAISG